jgi:hypothetical protein
MANVRPHAAPIRPFITPTRPSTEEEWMIYMKDKWIALSSLDEWIERAKLLPQAQPSDKGFVFEKFVFSFAELNVNEYVLHINFQKLYDYGLCGEVI